MIVCLCEGVNERAVKAAIEMGARTPAELARSCGAGSSCGQCVPVLRDSLAAARKADLLRQRQALAAR